MHSLSLPLSPPHPSRLHRYEASLTSPRFSRSYSLEAQGYTSLEAQGYADITPYGKIPIRRCYSDEPHSDADTDTEHLSPRSPRVGDDGIKIYKRDPRDLKDGKQRGWRGRGISWGEEEGHNLTGEAVGSLAENGRRNGRNGPGPSIQLSRPVIISALPVPEQTPSEPASSRTSSVTTWPGRISSSDGLMRTLPLVSLPLDKIAQRADADTRSSSGGATGGRGGGVGAVIERGSSDLSSSSAQSKGSKESCMQSKETIRGHDRLRAEAGAEQPNRARKAGGPTHLDLAAVELTESDRSPHSHSHSALSTGSQLSSVSPNQRSARTPRRSKMMEALESATIMRKRGDTETLVKEPITPSASPRDQMPYTPRPINTSPIASRGARAPSLLPECPHTEQSIINVLPGWKADTLLVSSNTISRHQSAPAKSHVDIVHNVHNVHTLAGTHSQKCSLHAFSKVLTSRILKSAHFTHSQKCSLALYRAHVCVCACVRACVRACVCV